MAAFTRQTSLRASSRACQTHFLAQHPLPDFGEALALADPHARVVATLVALYDSYRRREPMTANVLRDRHLLPALDALMAHTMDAQQAKLAEALAAGFGARGQAALRVRAVVALALDFWTWHRLTREGLEDRAAADFMADLAAGAAGREIPTAHDDVGP